MGARLKLAAAVLAAAAIFTSLAHVAAQPSPPAAAPQSSALAKAMADALRSNPGGVGQIPTLARLGEFQGEEKAAFDSVDNPAFDIVLQTTGERVYGANRMWLAVDISGWLMARRPLTAAKAEMYLSRYRKLDKATIDAWRTEQAKSARPGNSPSLTMSAIVFQDYLWEGGDWKAGEPARSLARLGSLSMDAVTRWDAVAVRHGNDVYGAWSLVAVDGLFVDNAFQQARFDSAYDEAVRLLDAAAAK